MIAIAGQGHAATAAMQTRIERRLDTRLQSNASPPVALALSGGGDSIALLAIAADWARRRGRRLLAMTVDHGLNADAADWSRACARAAYEYGADWIGLAWAGDKPTTGLTAAARRARHTLIADAARQSGARVVLFAHTADDVAEADWMRARGSTLGRLREWSPSPAWPEGRGLMLFRPMLDVRRADLRAWLIQCGLSWIEDPANRDDRFARSRARHALALATSTDMGPETGETVGTPLGLVHDSMTALPLGAGFRTGRGLSPRVLAALALSSGGGAVPPRGHALQRLVTRLATGQDVTATLSGARIQARGVDVSIGRETGELSRRPLPPLILQPDRPAVWDGRFEVTTDAPGWSVVAAAGRLSRLPDVDRRRLAAVPAWARGGMPVLIRNDPDGGRSEGPILAHGHVDVRPLAPLRFRLALAGFGIGVHAACEADLATDRDASIAGETTQETALDQPDHGEPSPNALF